MHYAYVLKPFLYLCFPTRLDYVNAVFSHPEQNKNYSETYKEVMFLKVGCGYLCAQIFSIL
jgi:hypothetical protein